MLRNFINKGSALSSSIIKSLTGKYATYLIQFLFLAIYARIFTPKDFGVVASVQLFIIFFQLIADIGIGPALISLRRITVQQRDGIFSVTIILGVILSLCFYFSSPILSLIYNGFDFTGVAEILSISILFNALLIVPLTSLNKDIKFLTVAKIDSVSETIAFFAVFLLYKTGLGVFALISRASIKSFLRFIFTIYASKSTTIGQPRVGLELYHFKIIFKFSTYQFLFNLVNYFSRNLDNLLIGKYFGLASLGLYDKAYQLMRYPLMLTTFGLNRAIQPVVTQFRNDVDRVVTEHNKLTARLLVVSLLISIFIFFNAREIVYLLFGEQWVSVTPIIEVFSLMIPLQSVLSTAGAFYQSMNKPKLHFISGLIAACFNISAIIYGIYLGSLQSVAQLLVLSFSLNYIQCYCILFYFCFRKSANEFIKKQLLSCVFISFPALAYILSNTNLKVFNFSSITSFAINIFTAVIVLALFLALPFYRRSIKKICS